MNKLIAIVAGEPNSINSEIIAKSLKLKKRKKNIFIIGNHSILKNQINKLGIKIQIVKITDLKDFKKQEKIFVLDVPIKSKSKYNLNLLETKAYIFNSLNMAHRMASKKIIKGFINAPVNKKIFSNRYLGVTEYLSSKNKIKNKEVMLIYNKELSVVPLTTHIEIKKVTNRITFNLIMTKILTLNNFYSRLFKTKPKIAILGLNPHNSENRYNSIENKIISKAIKRLKKIKIDIEGPFPADTAFNKKNRVTYDVIVGMYHDQVLAPFKALYGYDAINLTLGLKYLRLSPDHGTAKDIAGLNRANPQSLISAINFLNKIND
jgi:4-hydroxythreonine-4-phosphate dehydrogenase